MTLNLFRFHQTNDKCAGGHKGRTSTYESDENRRKHKLCHCPIYASGKLGGRFERKSTGCQKWEEAKAWAQARIDADSWGGESRPQSTPTVQEAPEEPATVTTEEAIEQFTRQYRKHARQSTAKNYECILEKLRAHGERAGIVHVKNWKPADVRALRDSWELKRTTAKKYMVIIRMFFKFCYRENEWGLEKNPAEIGKFPGGISAEERSSRQKHPFTDAEVQRMLAACKEYGDQDNGRYRKWKGDDLADFIMVSIHTGLRISDMCKFSIERLDSENRCVVRATKNGKEVRHKLPAWLADRMRWRAGKHGPYIFGQPESQQPYVYTGPWRSRLLDLWALCGEFTHKPTPHRFRHTFARILLQTEGVAISHVADLMGDTIETVREHYSDWVPERQARLDAAMDAAFKGSVAPDYLRPHLVA